MSSLSSVVILFWMRFSFLVCLLFVFLVWFCVRLFWSCGSLASTNQLWQPLARCSSPSRQSVLDCCRPVTSLVLLPLLFVCLFVCDFGFLAFSAFLLMLDLVFPVFWEYHFLQSTLLPLPTCFVSPLPSRNMTSSTGR